MTKSGNGIVKETLRRIINALPGGNAIAKAILRRLRYCKDYLRLARLGNADEIFHHYYATNKWGNEESVCGPGSTIRSTENTRKEIPRLVNELGAKVVLDAPCGDYFWFKMITWEKRITYIGGDIVKPLIERNQLLYGNHNTNFIILNIVYDVLPTADLWLCRDCLFHLSEHDIVLSIDNFINSNIKYLLTSTFSECDKNYDIKTGSYRMLNLQIKPFSFGKPMTVIDDWLEGSPIRHLGLWERDALKNNLASNK